MVGEFFYLQDKVEGIDAGKGALIHVGMMYVALICPIIFFSFARRFLEQSTLIRRQKVSDFVPTSHLTATLYHPASIGGDKGGQYDQVRKITVRSIREAVPWLMPSESDSLTAATD